MESLFEYSNKLLEETKVDFLRYMFYRINWQNRLVGLTGPRGVGKTTMTLQYIKKHLPAQLTLYVTAEDYYFARNRLLDLANDLVQTVGNYLLMYVLLKYTDELIALM